MRSIHPWLRVSACTPAGGVYAEGIGASWSAAVRDLTAHLSKPPPRAW
jgi:hypothetical protein